MTFNSEEGTAFITIKSTCDGCGLIVTNYLLTIAFYTLEKSNQAFLNSLQKAI